MPSNVEIKAHLRDRVAVERRLRALGARGPQELAQHDSFYAAPHGRLKLRRIAGQGAELIFYQRPDAPGPKVSEYSLCLVPDAQALDRVLRGALGGLGELRKRRTLYLLGATRVHLDQVEGLGDFLELEVVLGAADTAAEGQARAHELLEALGVAREDLVVGAYLDLVSAT